MPRRRGIAKGNRKTWQPCLSTLIIWQPCFSHLRRSPLAHHSLVGGVDAEAGAGVGPGGDPPEVDARLLRLAVVAQRGQPAVGDHAHRLAADAGVGRRVPGGGDEGRGGEGDESDCREFISACIVKRLIDTNVANIESEKSINKT